MTHQHRTPMSLCLSFETSQRDSMSPMAASLLDWSTRPCQDFVQVDATGMTSLTDAPEAWLRAPHKVVVRLQADQQRIRTVELLASYVDDFLMATSSPDTYDPRAMVAELKQFYEFKPSRTSVRWMMST
eukprot:CAMPEP_0206039198 /NCGR_PEP_ID=MMETSP1466-20131121/4594_1 /ASSEMBLY_ACC=CAM_ASM_001126 /TAXON_ID=44452 /ORGANISM="Pavlova gyrans, Strain CCMP608" /LENGTH=128 /DNA_ID=CAMNT_0053413819 /DNA_START=83 /DNA_END=470 /DNA_ORIENTATION=-